MVKNHGSNREFHSLSEIISHILDPLLHKRAGLNIQLLDNWAEIIGSDIAAATLPLKIIWSRNTATDEMFEPGILVVACEGFAAMKLQHESSQIIQRINVFFGYFAIERLKIRQGPIWSARQFVSSSNDRHCISSEQKNILKNMTSEISNAKLGQALFRLGENILGIEDMT